jgi:hypothetical protein
LLGVELGDEHGIESVSRWQRTRRSGGELLPVPRCYALVVGDGRKERGLVSIVRQNGEEVRSSNKGRMVRQGAPTKPATLRLAAIWPMTPNTV